MPGCFPFCHRRYTPPLCSLGERTVDVELEQGQSSENRVALSPLCAKQCNHGAIAAIDPLPLRATPPSVLAAHLSPSFPSLPTQTLSPTTRQTNRPSSRQPSVVATQRRSQRQHKCSGQLAQAIRTRESCWSREEIGRFQNLITEITRLFAQLHPLTFTRHNHARYTISFHYHCLHVASSRDCGGIS